MEGTRWFKRLQGEAKRISPYIRFKRIKHGFYRIYWKDAYLAEAYKEMPMIGYTHTDNDIRFEDKRFYESKEDRAELTRKVKNFVEGYVDSLDRLRTSVYMMKHDKEFYETSSRGYRELKIK